MLTIALPETHHGVTTCTRATGDLRASGLSHHSDRGWQYGSIRYGEALPYALIGPSVGTVGGLYNNALAGTVNCG